MLLTFPAHFVARECIVKPSELTRPNREDHVQRETLWSLRLQTDDHEVVTWLDGAFRLNHDFLADMLKTLVEDAGLRPSGETPLHGLVLVVDDNEIPPTRHDAHLTTYSLFSFWGLMDEVDMLVAMSHSMHGKLLLFIDSIDAEASVSRPWADRVAKLKGLFAEIEAHYREVTVTLREQVLDEMPVGHDVYGFGLTVDGE